MSNLKDTIMNIVNSLGGTADYHDIVNDNSVAVSDLDSFDTAIDELVVEGRLTQDDIGLYNLMD